MVLKQSAKGLKWSDMNFRAPDKYLEENGDKCLYDDTTWFLLSKQLGFMGVCQITSDKEYLKSIQTLLFIL